MSHGNPCIRHNDITSDNSFRSIGCSKDFSAILIRQLLDNTHDSRIWVISSGSGNTNIHSQLGGTQCQIVQDIVSISNPGNSLSFEVSTKMIVQRHEIGKSLKRMMKIRKSINDWNSRMLGKFQNIVMPKDSSQNNGIESTEYQRSVFHALVDSKLNVGWSKEKSMSAKERNTRFRRYASTSRALLENHTHGFSHHWLWSLERIDARVLAISVSVLLGKINEALQFSVAVTI